MLDISGALGDAFKRTKYLLWERRSFGRWWRYALLAMLTGGGLNFKFPFQSFKFPGKENPVADLGMGASSFPQFHVSPLLVVGIASVVLLLGLFFGWLSSCANFVLLESVVYDRQVLSEPFARLSSKGTGLFLWSALIVLGAMVPCFCIVGGGVGLGLAFRESSKAALIAITLGCLVIFTILALLLGTFFALTQHFVVPVAYRQRIGINPAWALVGQTLKNRKLDCLLFLVCLVGLMLAGGMGVMMGVVLTTGVVTLAAGLVLGLPAILLYKAAMGVPATVCVILFAVIVIAALFLSSLFFQTPLSIMARCFGLYVMQQMMPEFGLLPLGGRPEAVVEDEIGPEESRPLGSLPEETWERPEL